VKFRRLVMTLAVLLGMSASIMFHATPASAATSGDFVSSINNLRASKGLGTLSVDAGLSSIAQKWAEHMAAAGGISHNPSYSAQAVGDWRKLGENVGVGGDVSGLMTAFINSAAHYRNLVDSSYNRVGVGVAVGSDGRIYTTHDFANYPSGGSSNTPTTSKKSSNAPATTAKPAPAPAPSSKQTSNRKSTSSSAPAAPAPTTTAPAPAPAAQPAPEAPVAAPTPVLPPRILHGIVELESMARQG
jgi:hypothetical protein